jgi:hypothetical protein
MFVEARPAVPAIQPKADRGPKAGAASGCIEKSGSIMFISTRFRESKERRSQETPTSEGAIQRCADLAGIAEVTVTFSGHHACRSSEWQRG